jgi:hypothetical protein
MNVQAYRIARGRRTSILVAAMLALALAGTAGCASRRFDALMDSWQGHSLDDLFRTWGPPNFLYADGAGGAVAVYVPAANAGGPRTEAARERMLARTKAITYEPSMRNAWPIYRLFIADDAGRILRTEWRGQWECCSS